MSAITAHMRPFWGCCRRRPAVGPPLGNRSLGVEGDHRPAGGGVDAGEGQYNPVSSASDTNSPFLSTRCRRHPQITKLARVLYIFAASEQPTLTSGGLQQRSGPRHGRCLHIYWPLAWALPSHLLASGMPETDSTSGHAVVDLVAVMCWCSKGQWAVLRVK